MSLSSLIVQREVATIRQVEEALARQVLYGGDLVTNLLEVVQLPEAVLVPLLAESLGMVAAPVGLLPPPTAPAKALVPEDVATRRAVMPLSVEGDRLVLVVSEPLGKEALEELSFAFGVHIDQRVAPSVRIREALARAYGLPLERRMARLVGRLAGVDPSVPNSLPPLVGPKASVPPLPGALSHDVPKLNPPGMPPIGTLRFPEPGATGVAGASEGAHEIPSQPPSSLSFAEPTLASPLPSPGGRAPSTSEAALDATFEAPSPADALVPTDALARAEARAPLPSKRPSLAPDARVLPRLLRDSKPNLEKVRRRGPLTLDRVTEELPLVDGREALLHLFFDFGRQFFEYSAIFVVHADLAEGRDAFGSGAPKSRVVALGVPLDIPSVLRSVRERGVPLCIFPQEGGLDAVLMSDLRRALGSQVLVVPVVVRARVVAFFIADDGTAGIDPSAQGEVTTVAALVGREFERLIVRSKLQGFTGETAAPAREVRVDARRVQPKPRRRDLEAREAAVLALGKAVSESVRPPGVAPPASPPTRPSSRPPSTIPGPPAALSEASDRPDVSDLPALSVRPDARTTEPDFPASVLPPKTTEPPALPPQFPSAVGTLPAPALAPPSDRPGGLRPDSFLTFAASTAVAPLPRPSDTLRNFLVPLPSDRPRAALPTQPEDEAGDDADDDAERRSFDSFDPPPSFDDESALLRVRATVGELSDRPPPPQTLAVRRPSGAPIPREELDEDGNPISSTRFVSDRFSSRPPPPVADLRQARLLREIDALTAQFSLDAPEGTRGPPSSRVSQSVSIPPHRPPSSRAHLVLPSVIVNVDRETDELALAFVNDPKDEHAEMELLRLGQQAMPSIMKHFPGPLTISRDTLDDTWPRVTACGPVLRLIAGQRRIALPFVLARTEDADHETRFWATYLLTELAYPEAVPAVVARLFDDSKRIRRAAGLVLHLLGYGAGPALVAELDRIVRDPKVSSARRVVTLDTLGEVRDRLVVPVLLGALVDDDEDVALAARRALMLVTRQDFGRDPKKWALWWSGAASRHRVEWLIDALTHETPALRRAAGQELKGLTEQFFGYYDDLPRKDRERAQEKYRAWWRTDGYARFRKR